MSTLCVWLPCLGRYFLFLSSFIPDSSPQVLLSSCSSVFFMCVDSLLNPGSYFVSPTTSFISSEQLLNLLSCNVIFLPMLFSGRINPFADFWPLKDLEGVYTFALDLYRLHHCRYFESVRAVVKKESNILWTTRAKKTKQKKHLRHQGEKKPARGTRS